MESGIRSPPALFHEPTCLLKLWTKWPKISCTATLSSTNATGKTFPPLLGVLTAFAKSGVLYALQLSYILSKLPGLFCISCPILEMMFCRAWTSFVLLCLHHATTPSCLANWLKCTRVLTLPNTTHSTPIKLATPCVQIVYISLTYKHLPDLHKNWARDDSDLFKFCRSVEFFSTEISIWYSSTGRVPRQVHATLFFTGI